MALITSHTFYFKSLDELKSEMLYFFASRGHKIDWCDGVVDDHSAQYAEQIERNDDDVIKYYKAPYGLNFGCKNTSCYLFLIGEFYQLNSELWSYTVTVCGGYADDYCESKISRLMR